MTKTEREAAVMPDIPPLRLTALDEELNGPTMCELSDDLIHIRWA